MEHDDFRRQGVGSSAALGGLLFIMANRVGKGKRKQTSSLLDSDYLKKSAVSLEGTGSARPPDSGS
jgi:hypothetical protein